MGIDGPLPDGVVTLCFTDVEGSTRLVELLGPDRFADVLERMREVVLDAVDRCDGRLVGTEGDGMFLAFGDAPSAVDALTGAQRALAQVAWVGGAAVAVRMGIHTGEARVATGRDYVGLAVHQAARLADVAHGGQILLSPSTVAAVGDRTPALVGSVELGRFHVRDFPEPLALRQIVHPDLRRNFPAPRTPAAVVHNLRRTATMLVGREEDVAELPKLLATESLVTLVGTGGVGKSRLAVAVAERCTGEFDGGVFLVELDGVDDGGLVVPSIASALGVADAGETTLDAALRVRLADKRTLLLLDCCEHVVDAVATVAQDVITRTSSVVLATSREPIGVRGESVWRVDPLPTLDPDGDGDDGALRSSPAVRLFAERATRADRRFDLDATGALAAVARVCRLVEGLPLAVELAAGRIASQTVTEVAASLDRDLTELAGGYRTDAPRHRGLAATIEWSAGLLEGEELAVLEQLSVFRGGWTTSAAVAVTGEDRAGALVDRLADRSLVEVDDGARCRLLEPVRQWAAQRLSPSLADDLARRHATWLDDSLSDDHDAVDAGSSEVLEAWGRELDNIAAAVRWGVEARAPVVGRLATNAAPLLRMLGRTTLCLGWIEAVLTLDLPPTTALKAAAARATALLRIQDLDAANGALGEQVRRAETAGDVGEAAVARGLLGIVRFQLGDPSGIELIAAAPAELRAAGLDGQARAAQMNHASALARTGQPAAAQRIIDELLSVAREIGDKNLEVTALLNRAATMEDEGVSLDALLAAHREALAAAEEAGHVDAVSLAQLNLALELRNRGELDEARLAMADVLAAGRRGRHDLRTRAAWSLAYDALDRDDPAADALFDEAEVAGRISGNGSIVAHALAHRAVAAGDGAAADALLAEAVALVEPSGWDRREKAALTIAFASTLVERAPDLAGEALLVAAPFAPPWAAGAVSRLATALGVPAPAIGAGATDEAALTDVIERIRSVLAVR